MLYRHNFLASWATSELDSIGRKVVVYQGCSIPFMWMDAAANHRSLVVQASSYMTGTMRMDSVPRAVEIGLVPAFAMGRFDHSVLGESSGFAASVGA